MRIRLSLTLRARLGGVLSQVPSSSALEGVGVPPLGQHHGQRAALGRQLGVALVFGQRGFNSLLKSLPTLCSPTDCSTLGFPGLHCLPEIFPKFMSTQLVMWILERVAISFSRGSF